MSIADPLEIAASSPTPATSLAVTDRSKPFQADRQDAGGVYSASISHTASKNGAQRHYIVVRQRVIATSPVTGLDSVQTASVSVSIAVPPFGFDTVAMSALYKYLTDTVSAATLVKILNNES